MAKLRQGGCSGTHLKKPRSNDLSACSSSSRLGHKLPLLCWAFLFIFHLESGSPTVSVLAANPTSTASCHNGEARVEPIQPKASENKQNNQNSQDDQDEKSKNGQNAELEAFGSDDDDAKKDESDNKDKMKRLDDEDEDLNSKDKFKKHKSKDDSEEYIRLLANDDDNKNKDKDSGKKVTTTPATCYGIYVPSGKNEGCNGLEKSVTPLPMAKQNEKWSLLKVRAVKYVPRPAGAASGLDLYTSAFTALHTRDLYLISELKANTIRLDPWIAGNDHSSFLRRCNEHGLFVIPTFDIKKYMNPKVFSNDLSMLQDLAKELRKFMQLALRSDHSSQILAWSVNYAPPLNETVRLGPKSTDVESDELKHYFKLLCVVRHAHFSMEWDDDQQRYKRPLAVPVDLNSRKTDDDVGWYLGFTETKWGKWPDCTFWGNSPLEKDGAPLPDAAFQMGMFDTWIAEGLALQGEVARKHLQKQFSQFNATVKIQTGTGMAWNDPTTRTQKDRAGKMFKECKNSGGCSYPTRKAVLAQFGFAAIATEVEKHSHEEHKTGYLLQQESLQSLWSDLMTDPITCASGGVVDEFMDNWDRNEQLGCKSQPYIHAVSQDCSEIGTGVQVYPEWLGLHDQYTFMTMHCIRPRLDDEKKGFCFDGGPDKNLCQRQDYGIRRLCSSLSLSLLSSQIPFRIPLWICIATASIVLCVLPLVRIIWLLYCKDAGTTERSGDDGESSVAPSNTASREDASPVGAQRTAARRQSVAVLAGQVPDGQDNSPGGANSQQEFCVQTMPIPVPEVFWGGAKSCREFKIQLAVKLDKRHKKANALMYLEAHARVQYRRLLQQIKSESLAFRSHQHIKALDLSPAERKDPEKVRKASWVKGLEVVHARALEGYLAWLEYQCDHHKTDDRDKARLQALLGTDGEEKKPRAPELLWIDALLLRCMESLAEHLLHAPELLHLIYHRARWRKVEGGPPTTEDMVDLELDRVAVEETNMLASAGPGGKKASGSKSADLEAPSSFWTYEINLGELHQGLDLMVDPASTMNPFRGGINFDDLNDCGLDYRKTIKLQKTYRESPSLMVLLDCLSNFQPVFTIKMWVFFISWGIYHGHVATAVVDGKMEVEDIVHSLVFADGLVLSTIEVLTAIVGFCVEKRCNWHFNTKRWITQRIIYLLLGSFAILISKLKFAESKPADSEAKTDVRLILQYVYIGIRIASFIFLNLGSDNAYLMGAPKARRRPKAPGKRRIGLAAWIGMLSCCCAFETWLVVPLSSGFNFADVCQDACSWETAPPFWVYWSASCLSCGGAMICIWFVVGLTAFFDIYYMFYLGTAVYGYCMGHSRGLNGILATAQWFVDLSSGNPTDHLALEAMTEGQILEQVFGSSWRMVWSKIVEQMYEEDLVSDTQANTIVEAAGTMRWPDRSRPVTELRFRLTEAGGQTLCAKTGQALIRPECIAGAQYKTSADDEWKNLEFRMPDLHEGQQAQMADFLVAKLSEPTMVHSFRFQPGADPRLDPIHWELIGQVVPRRRTGDVTRRVLIKHRKAPASREFCEELFVDPWLDHHAPGQSCGLRLDETLSSHAAEQLGFFCKSLQKILAGMLARQSGDSSENSNSSSNINSSGGDSSSNAAGEGGVGSSSSQLGGSSVGVRTSHSSALTGLTTSTTLPAWEQLLSCDVGAIPTLSQIIPCYDENVINDARSLRDSDNVNTNLAFIISEYPKEWDHFAARMLGGRENPGLSNKLYHDFIEDKLDATATLEVRFWAAMRSQTVARTIAGAMQYHTLLDNLPSTHAWPDKADEGQHCKGFAEEMSLRGHLCQLILAHQTFGNLKDKNPEKSVAENEASVLNLMARYKKYPFFVVFDYDHGNAAPGVRELVREYCREHFRSEVPKHVSVMVRCKQDFMGGITSTNGNKITASQIPFRQALEVVEILPRYYPLLLAGDGGTIRTQGKAGNQLGALRFAAGHYIQMMDANMGAGFTEACKVPLVLRNFLGKDSDRKTPECRILGFREFIFTEKHGTMGSIMASSEWSFGTICQRFLDGLNVRMHYGHPDFIDGFWASNRGSLSKASPMINLSEDIFAGFNAKMRGERSIHSDALAWEKGRESSFNASCLFFSKVSGGNVGVMRSRDLKILSEQLSLIDNLSFYFASIGFYLNNWLIDHSLTVYLLIFVFLTMASQSLDSVGRLGSMLAAEWVVSMGIIAMCPRLMELTLEYGWLEGLARFVKSVPGIMVAFTFINKSIASSVAESMRTGEASYIQTGRPNANTHYDWRECYFVHAASHYYPAMTIFMWYGLYLGLTQEMDTVALPMFVILGTAICWLTAPMIFCPQPTFKSLASDMSTYWKFLVAKPKLPVRRMPNRICLEEQLHNKLTDQQSNLYEFWLANNLHHKRRSRWQQFALLVWDFVGFAFLLGVMTVSSYSMAWKMFVAFIAHTLLMLVWRAANRPQVLVMFAAGAMFAGPWYLANEEEKFCDYLLAAMILLQGLAVFKHVILLTFRVVVHVDPKCYKKTYDAVGDRTENGKRSWWCSRTSDKTSDKKNNRNYDILVEFLYIDFLEYELHLFKGHVVLAFNFVSQLSLVLLDSLGLHSFFLLNSKLGCALGIFCNRKPYEPGKRSVESSGHGQRQPAPIPSRLEMEDMRRVVKKPLIEIEPAQPAATTTMTTAATTAGAAGVAGAGGAGGGGAAAAAAAAK